MYSSKKIPIKVIFDNMEISYSNMGNKSNVAIDMIWDDENEIVYSYRVNNERHISSAQYPIELMASTYEMIQFIAQYLPATEALDFLDNNADETNKEHGKYILSCTKSPNNALDMSHPANRAGVRW